MKVLVTGATGKLGSAVCEALRARDIEVRARARSIERLPAGTAKVRFDYGDPSIYVTALDGVQRVTGKAPVTFEEFAKKKADHWR